MTTVFRERHFDGGSTLDIVVLHISTIDVNWRRTKLEDFRDLFGVVSGVIVSISNASDRDLILDQRGSTHGISRELEVNYHRRGHCDLLGFDHYIPPYANTNGTDIAQGVNYASGAAGIRNETGTHMGQDISMGLQLEHHRDIVSQIAKKLGSEKVQQHLNKCLYYVNIGSNDYLNNYFLPQHYPTNGKYNADQYAVALIQEHLTYLKALYELGARKFSLFGLSLIGCIPHGKNDSLCVEEHNRAALLFNNKLKSVVDRFNKEFPDAKFIFINTAIITENSLKQDMKILTCCKVGSNGQCIPNEEPCQNRNLHPFFDEFHPSEVVNKVLANMAYNAPVPAFAHPMDISHLVKL
ncbi:hypothetical protein KIW84_071714 [Lathyrus oleraceus]|uniref:Uncharacterized protein n=1 Tax=Pisum sativum TaxID=3888 RepID=A0A9D4ZV47_PEA|nr:hypothetical protein KIW84_071714 [Pisum sativum]